MAKLNKDLPIPLYHQLKDVLLNSIRNGEWEPNQQLPTEQQLAGRYQVSKITVRQALRELSDLGLVRRKQGSGTFVAPARPTQGPRALTSFTEEMRRMQFTPSSRVLLQCVCSPEPTVEAALKLPPYSAVMLLKRLRLANGEPMGIQNAWLPPGLVPGLERFEIGNASLYETIQRKYELRPAAAKELHWAVLIDGEDAELLKVPPRSAGLATERVTYLGDGRPLEFSRALMRGDRYRIVLDLMAGPTRE
jgi:GntR family transcriptional regulator